MATEFDVLSPSASVPLRTVVTNPGLGLRPVAESLRSGALDRPIRWAHVSELREPAPYLLGEELLLSAGVNLALEQAEVDAYVRGLLSAGVSALGFGITPPMHDELPARLRHACVRNGLPLLVIPPTTPFLAVSRAVAVEINETTQRERRRVSDARAALTKAAGASADTLVAELAHHLDGWVALVGPHDVVAAQHRAPCPLPTEVAELLVALRGGAGNRSATTELDDGMVVVAQPLFPQNTSSPCLVIGSSRFDNTDRAIIGVGAALLGLVRGSKSDSAALSAAMTTLLLERDAPGKALEELWEPGPRRVVAGFAHGRGPGEYSRGYDWLCGQLGTPLVHPAQDDRFTAITAAAPPPAVLDDLLAAGWLTVVSSPRQAADLPRARDEIDVLAQRARVLGRPLCADDPLRADDGGFGLASVMPEEVAASFAQRVLGPIKELDSARGGGVLRTLRTWLAHHGNWDRTAAALDLHRNSVRHRIAQAARALDVDMADPQVRMELWFALQSDRQR